MDILYLGRKGRWDGMPQNLDEILKRYVADVHNIYGEQLKAVILYGSYARGDFGPDSDIDIMILVDLPDDEIRSRGHTLSDITFDYNFDNQLEIMPIVSSPLNRSMNPYLNADYFENRKRKKKQLRQQAYCRNAALRLAGN